MSISTRKRQANRLNALKSTGPKTSEGKSRCRYNAITHGLFAQSLVLPGEDETIFAQFNRSLLLRLNPRDALELQLAQQIIAASWKSQRALEAESRLFQIKHDELDEEETDELEREVNSLEGDVELAARRLRHTKHDKDELEAEHKQAIAAHEEARRKLDDPLAPILGGVLLASIIQSNDPALERIHRYQQRLDNSMHRALKQLRELQKQPIEEPSELTQSLIEENMQNEATEDQPHANPNTADELEPTPRELSPAHRDTEAPKNAHGAAVGPTDVGKGD
ncbi:MAG TPA: hypothetical protein VHD56_18045 [Tepidisphaeraceae bacterium]|nr:hypothetical protein [Tepidisphaeraceae bacterium]